MRDIAAIIAAAYRRNAVVLWPLLVLAVSLSLTYFVARSAQQDVELQLQSYFDFRVRDAVNRIAIRMQAYKQVLRGSAGLFAASVSVERIEFKQYVAALRLQDSFPGIQGVGFSLIVPAAEKARHIAAIRGEGFPDYSIRPQGQRDLYTSIVYLEPFSGRNLRAFGYDMYSEPVRHAAMQKALESGEEALSGKVRLVQEFGEREQAGFLVYLPIYRNTAAHASLRERQEHALGWVYAPFRMNDFMKGALGEQAADLSINIFDGEHMTPDALMFDSSALASANASHIPTYQATKRLQLIDNHPWTIHISASPTMLTRVDSNKPSLFAVVGACGSLLLTILVWMLITGRERAINAARAMNEELIAEQYRLSSIIEGTHVGTWEWNVQTGETAFNRYWAKIIGYELSEIEPVSIETWIKFTHPDDLKISDTLLKQHFAHETEHYECEARMRHKNGHWVWVLDRGKVATWTSDGKPLMMFGTHQEITQRKLEEQKVRFDAEHDALTRLPNRALLNDRLQQALAIAKRDKEKLALMFIDLDKFKPVNDKFGHDVGDLLLKEVAQRIQGCLRESDTVARVGGDEFVVLLPSVNEETDAIGVAEKIRHALNLPFDLAGHHLEISSSTGIAIYPDHGHDEHSLTKSADIAMYWAKANGRNNVQLFQPDPHPTASGSSTLALGFSNTKTKE